MADRTERIRIFEETLALGREDAAQAAPNYRAFRAVESPGIPPEDPEIRPEEAEARRTPEDEKADAWLRLLRLTDRLNRRVKEPGWGREDRQTVYALKDRMLRALLRERPACVAMTLRSVPCVLYSPAAKDRAGELMRRDGHRYAFEYYLTQVPPGPEDLEIPEKALVELEAACGGETFCFHMPAALAEDCGVACAGLPRKPWTAAPLYFHRLLEEVRPAVEDLLAAVERS
jgi:hypothetical protein